MRHLRRLLTVIVITLGGLLRAYGEPDFDPAGHWEGIVALPGSALIIRVDLEKAGEVWSGTIDIPVQGLRAYQLQPVKVVGDAVTAVLPNIPGNPTLSGQLDKKTGAIDGGFTQSGLTFPFKLERKPRPAPVTGETPAKGVPGEGLAGYWQASLKPVPIMELRLTLEVTKSTSGKYDGLMISVDQGEARMPVSSLTESEGAVAIKVSSIGGSFAGKLSADGSEINGEWQQAGPKLPLSFKRLAGAPDFRRPQDPIRPYPYREEEVSVPHPAAAVTLAGTLTLPPGDGPHPAVVLITGSGPQDRNEALMGHRPFLVLADHLTRAGFAVLRCDDRGIGQSTGDFSKAVVDDFVADTLAAVTWLQARPEIDARRIGLIGHSEGGMVAPLAAVKKPDAIAFIVLLAGVGVPVEDLLIRQSSDLERVAGSSETEVARNHSAQRELFALLKESLDQASLEKRAIEIMRKQLNEYTPERLQALGITEAFIESQSKMVASPWFRSLAAYDPRPTLSAVKCPVLAINGERDLQVSAKENLTGIREALVAGGNARVRTESLPGLNHLFQTCTTGSVAEYGQIEETFAPAALEIVSSWLREQVTPPKP